jgi:hypothetical protein
MDQQQINDFVNSEDRRRDARRAFLHSVGGAGALIAGAGLLAGCDNTFKDDPLPAPAPTPTPTPAPGVTDADVFNFALNLEYLEAQFYSFAAFGSGLPPGQLTGTGTQGGVTGGRAVPFVDPLVRLYAREIARDETQHVAFLRRTLGTAAVAQPQLDIGGTDPNGAFSNAARAAGLVGAGVAFDPYANDENFLLAAFIFEDVGVTAYKGAVSLISNKTFVEAAAGIHAAEAYHAGLIRTVLYRKGLATPALITSAGKISDARDSLDGASDIDQGIAATGTGADITANIVPTDNSGIAFSRSAGQVLNVVYLNKASVTAGGFFPAGVNGTIKASAAS